ncbi:FAD-binding oxidoreductase, partial [candidate division WOR-3 bacterium]|nr:FAD-binding oxidoreductase [candidate division WOR-3 bacterium]
MIKIEGSEILSVNPDLLSDESNMPGAWCNAAFMPEKADEAGDVLRKCYIENIPVTLSSARTGLVGGALPFGGALVSLSRLEKKIEISDDKDTIRALVSSSVTLDELQAEGAKKGVYFPPNPTESTASMGGIASTDASGSRSYRYGSARNFVMRVKGFYSDGMPFDIKRNMYFLDRDYNLEIQGRGVLNLSGDFPKKMRKNTVGYNLWPEIDLVDILCGNEGTLALLTEVELLLKKIPEFVFTGMFFFRDTKKLLEFIDAFEFQMPKTLRSVEYLDPNSLEFLKNFYSDKKEIVSYLPEKNCEVLFADFEAGEEEADIFYEKLEKAAELTGIDMDEVFGGDTKKEAEIVHNIRHSLPEAVNHRIKEVKREHPGIHKVGSDMAVPVDKTLRLLELFRENLRNSGLQYVIFGHIGDGHPHVNVLPQNPEELKKAKEIYSYIAREV